ncbi:MAG: hypothetical protein Q8P59_08075, partial [Dehalococcoidia bacterium]|nr:hypothetical protein [Dehalococcoidia bacterium]
MPAAAYPAGVQLKLEGLADEFRINYSITLINATDRELDDITVTVPLPTESRFQEIVTTPQGATVKSRPGSAMVWALNKLAARSSIGPFTYKIQVPGREAGTASAKAEWQQPTVASVAAPNLEFNFDKIAINRPKRGCTACHYLRDEKTGAVTIAYEAMERGGPKHPKLPFDTVVTTCLGCHKPGTGARENMGVVAPKMLRDIVHPVHLNSPSFTGPTYKGNCFTCHNVDGKGNFVLLGEKLHTDFRGIPEEVPVKGIPP